MEIKSKEVIVQVLEEIENAERIRLEAYKSGREWVSYT